MPFRKPPTLEIGVTVLELTSISATDPSERPTYTFALSGLTATPQGPKPTWIDVTLLSEMLSEIGITETVLFPVLAT